MSPFPAARAPVGAPARSRAVPALGLTLCLAAMVGDAVAGTPLAAQEPAPRASVREGVPRVEGRVRAREADGGALLGWAMIAVEGGGSVLADGRGRYVLRGVRPGPVRLVARYVGYAPTEVEVLVPSRGVVTVDLELAREAVELPEIVVAGDRLRIEDPDERSLSAEAERALLRLHALEASPGLSESGLTGAVPPPGEGGGSSEPAEALYFRGSAADLKLVLLDGAPIYTPFHLGGLLPSFDASTLGSARHHVGGAPARYDGGLSYILDLRTRSPRRDRPRARGSVDLLSVGGSLETPLGHRAGALVSARRLHGLGAALAGGDGSPYGYADGLVRIDADAGASGSVFLTGFANRESVILDLTRSPYPAVEPLGRDDAEWGNVALTGGWTTRVGRATLELGASTSRYDAELPVHEAVWDSATSQVDRWTMLATGRTDRTRFTADATIPRDGAEPLRAGASFDRLRLRYGSRGRPTDDGTFDVEGSGSVLGLYVGGARPLVDALDLRWGARLDRFSVDALGDGAPESAFRGALRLALLWDLGDDAILTLAGGRYHQLARRGDADVDLAAGDGLQTGTGAVPESAYRSSSPILSVARADHLVASLDQRLGENVRLDTEVFFKAFHDVAGVASRRLTSSGIDLRVLRQTERTTTAVGYSLAWFWEPQATAGVTEFSGRHLLNASFRTLLVGPAVLDVRLALSDGLPLTSVPFGDEANSVPDSEAFDDEVDADPSPVVDVDDVDGFLRVDVELFAEWDLSLGGLGGRVRPYVRVLNALDRRDALFYYFEPWRSDELRPLAELSLVPVVGLEWRF
ncbi:MAG: hypothetical protein PVI57_14585 [Gemmatimonadota bacterium]|jgi:hypothetical protein